MPILLGVACGMFALFPLTLTGHEPAVFSRCTAWLFNEPPPVKVIEPRSIHFNLFMLSLAAIGGSIGVSFSRWRKRTAILFLLATLAVLATFSATGGYLDAHVWH